MLHAMQYPRFCIELVQRKCLQWSQRDQQTSQDFLVCDLSDQAGELQNINLQEIPNFVGYV